jgi:putative MATE family efflux protein
MSHENLDGADATGPMTAKLNAPPSRNRAQSVGRYPRHPFLEGAIAPALVRQALPVLVVLMVQTLVSVAETYFVGRLGTAPLGGMALVFPMLLLMTMISNGGMGGGVSSAVARALGEKRSEDADSLVTHALLIAAVCGLLCALGAWWYGPAMYARMGGEGAALDNALQYSNLAFAAAVPIWIVNLLSAALRGAGDVRTPALLVLAGACLTLALSPLLIFGMGPIPGMGIAGAGVAMILYYYGAAIALLTYLRSGRAPLRLKAGRIEARLIKSVLAVGIPASLGALQSNVVVVIFTGMVGHFGVAALAGYGIASRLDFVLMPLLFAIGTASIAMVSMNVGAGQHARARSVARTAAGLSGAMAGVIGAAAAIRPELWLALFTTNPDVIAYGAGYLTHVAPFYAVTGIGMALVFASQGARVVMAPLATGTCTLIFVAVASWYCVTVKGGAIESLYWVVVFSRILLAAGMVTVLLTASGWMAGKQRTTRRALQ